jgi:TolB-like protein/DNA-binding SARP family transcriptional activator
MTFFLQTFGGLKLVDSEGRQVAYPEKGLLLLAYLLTIKEGAEHRAAMATFLWGDEDNAVSLVNMRKMISRIKLRQDELGAQLLSFSSNMIHVERLAVSSDMVWVADEDEADPLRQLRNLATMMHRSFLGPVGCQSRDFYGWFSEQKDRQNTLLKALLKRVSRAARSEEDAEILKDAGILLIGAERADPDTLQLLVEVFNAQEEVDQLRKILEKRSNALARGADLVNATVNRDARQTATSAPAYPSLTSISEQRPHAEPDDMRRHAVPRLVLLPPSDHIGRPDSRFIANALIEDITIGFCAFNSLQVIAHHSAVQIGHQLEDQADFFQRHALNYILDSRISNQTSEGTLFVQLVFFPDNEVVWAERFSLSQPDLVAARRVIARNIALSVSSEIERHEATRLYRELNPAAYHSYLVGRRHLNRLTLPDLRRARKEMKTALHASTNFAPALSSIARTYSKEWLLTARGDIELLKSAEGFAVRAIDARRNMADGYRELGVAKLLQGAFDESAEAMELAETLGPHYADIIADHADTLVHCSLPSKALLKIERAIELNPLSPDSYLWTAAGANYALSQFETSLDYIGRMADPSLADRLSAANWAMLDQKDKARVFVRRVREANPNFDLETWLAAVPSKEQWHRDLYRDGLKRAGF